MSSAWNVFLLLSSVVCVGLVTSTSDPMAHLCVEACQTEITMAEECETSRGCDFENMDDDEFDECTSDCWTAPGRCNRMCRNRFYQTISWCYREVPDDAAYQQIVLCFVQRMEERKRRRAERRLQRIANAIPRRRRR